LLIALEDKIMKDEEELKGTESVRAELREAYTDIFGQSSGTALTDDLHAAMAIVRHLGTEFEDSQACGETWEARAMALYEQLATLANQTAEFTGLPTADDLPTTFDNDVDIVQKVHVVQESLSKKTEDVKQYLEGCKRAVESTQEMLEEWTKNRQTIDYKTEESVREDAMIAKLKEALVALEKAGNDLM